jgi:hypothetical protein
MQAAQAIPVMRSPAMKHISSAIFCVAIVSALGAPLAQSADKPAPTQQRAKAQTAVPAASRESSAAHAAATADAATTGVVTADAATADKKIAARNKTTVGERSDAADPLTANILGDTELANQRGGSDSHLNQNNSTGAVTGNVASQLNTGSNTISESAFSNSSGIPIVIQNSGNNVLIQNSTILNLQLANSK